MWPSDSFQNWKTIYRRLTESALHHPVQKWQIAGLDVWPLIRSFYVNECSYYFLAGIQNPPTKAPASFRSLAKDAVIRSVGKKNLKKAMAIWKARQIQPPSLADTDILFFGDLQSYISIDQVYVQQHLDPLRLCYEKQGLKTQNWILDLPTNSPVLQKSWLRRTYGVADIDALAGLLGAGSYTLRLSQLPGYEEWRKQTIEGTFLETYVPEQKLTDMLLKTLGWVRYLQKCFQTHRPKAVLQVSYYRPVGYALNYVCRQLQIPCIDVQHGLQGPLFHAYYFPHLEDKKIVNTLPTHFLTWSEPDKSNILTWSQGHGTTALAAGTSWDWIDTLGKNTSWQNLSVIENEIDLMTWEARSNQQIATVKAQKNAKKYILLTSHFREEIPHIDEILKFVKEQNYFVFWRLHPRESKSAEALAAYEKRFQDMPVEFRVASSAPLSHLFKNVDLHLSKYSGCCLEAAAFSVPSIVYSEQGWEFSRVHCEPVGFAWAHTLEDLQRLLVTSAVTSTEKRVSASSMTNYFPKPDFTDTCAVASHLLLGNDARPLS